MASSAITLRLGRKKSIGRSGSRKEPALTRAAMSSQARRLPGGRNTPSILGDGKPEPKSLPTVSNWTFPPVQRNWRRTRSPSSMIYPVFLRLKGESDHVKAHRCWSTGDHRLRYLLGTRRAIRDPGRAELRFHRTSCHRSPADPNERCRRSAQERAPRLLLTDC